MTLHLFPGMSSKSRRGMTFAEVVVAIAIVATVLVVIIGTLTSGLRALQKSTGYNQAVIIAHRFVEEFRTRDYAAVPLYNPGSPDEIIKNNFTIKTIIEEKTYLGTSENYKELTVNVTRGDVGDPKKRVDVTMKAYLILK